jgi:hypothetical protein
MRNNFTVLLFHEDASLQEQKEFKSLREIAKRMKLDYSVVCQINRISDKKATRKFMHPLMRRLMARMRIYRIVPAHSLSL